MVNEIAVTGAERAYHMAEAGKLNGEIAELGRTTAELFKWAVAGSGALFAWLLANKPPAAVLEAAAVIPILLTVVLAIMSFALAVRIQQMGCYLRTLEGVLGSSDLGWEKYFARKSSFVTWTAIAGWAVLLLCDILGAKILGG